MKTIAISNNKGGVAKTVTAVNIAAILAATYDKRVLVIDADSQANATEFLLQGETQSCKTLADALRYNPETAGLTPAQYAHVSVQPTALDNVWLMAADDSLMDLDLSAAKGGKARTTILREYLRDDACRSLYDYCLIDCPPAFNAASAAALLAADEVIIPIKLDAFALRGMGNLMRQITNMREINPGLRLGGILPTMWYNSEQIRTAEKALRQYSLPVYPHIRRSPKVDDMTFAQKPLIESSPKSGACQDYRVLVRRIVEGGEKNGL